MHSAARSSGGQPKLMFKPKPYWCPELSRLRDRKRFWWHIWDANGRPRQGIVYDCYKGTKKMFRKICRQKMQCVVSNEFQNINSLFTARKMTAFWNKIKFRKDKNVQSTLNERDFAMYYEGIMGTEGGDFDDQHRAVSEMVSDTLTQYRENIIHENFTQSDIDLAIQALRKNVSPGIDGICPEHFIYGKCEELLAHLSSLYNRLFLSCDIPSVLALGVIIPVLKKSTLDPNSTCHYRPITLSSTHSKLIETLLMPQDDAHPNQFGFRKGRSTAMACNLLNDLAHYCDFHGSPLYVCSLDAEKCFDSVWHDGLFFKLIDKLPQSHWLFLYTWYKSMKCVVRWNGSLSESFCIKRGTKQGSVLSPILFNIFINDLLIELAGCDYGVRIGTNVFNSFAYADDISVASLTTTGLQSLINICYQYAKKWRFSFGILKTKCCTLGTGILKHDPEWYLGDHIIDTAATLEILGTTFSCDLSAKAHIEKRIHASRRAMYSLAPVGCSYPGLCTEAKAHLWKAVGQTSLLYCLDIFSLTSSAPKLGLLRAHRDLQSNEFWDSLCVLTIPAYLTQPEYTL